MKQNLSTNVIYFKNCNAVRKKLVCILNDKVRPQFYARYTLHKTAEIVTGYKKEHGKQGQIDVNVKIVM